MRKIFPGLVALALMFNCAAEHQPVRRLKIAHGLNIDHPVHKAMEYLADRAALYSEGSIKIDIYPSEQLGTEKECIEQLQMGILSMTKVSSSPLESFVPKIQVFALPFLFRDGDHKWAVLNSAIGKELLVACAPKGLRGLCYYDAGARSFYTVKAPVLHPDDLRGLKIRTQQSPMAVDLVRSLGGSATPISWGELYTALQQGVVDGAENNEPSLYTSLHYEVAKHYSLDEHTMVPDVLLISTLQWEELTPDHQAILQRAADESVVYQRQLWAEFVRLSMEEMQSKGLQVYHPDKAPFKERTQQMYDAIAGTEIGELVKRIQEVR